MKVVWNTCGKELGGEMKSAYENVQKVFLKTSKSCYVLERLM